MELILISIIIFCSALIVLLTNGYISEAKADKRKDRLFASNNKLSEDDELTKPFSERFIKPTFYAIIHGVSRFTPNYKGDQVPKLERELKLSGLSLTTKDFSSVKIIITGSFIILALFSAYWLNVAPIVKILVLLIGLILGILVPRYYLAIKIRIRQKSIELQLPDVIDLLSVSVEAGLSFDAALLKVIERAKGALVDELTNVYREMQMGRPRRDALKALNDRTNANGIKTLTAALIQAEQLGISIKNVLNSQSKSLRQQRRQRAEEKALKAPVKMMIPLVIFIFPVIFIVLLGPSVISIMQTLKI